MLELRPYQPKDFETLYHIDHACYEPAIAYSRSDLRSYIQGPGAECIVAETDGEIVGFIVSDRTGRSGYIVTIDVLAAHRESGIGSMLLVECERKLAAHGVREITLETATDNPATVVFWEKRGYRTRRVKKGYYPGGRDAFEMAKPLANQTV